MKWKSSLETVTPNCYVITISKCKSYKITNVEIILRSKLWKGNNIKNKWLMYMLIIDMWLSWCILLNFLLKQQIAITNAFKSLNEHLSILYILVRILAQMINMICFSFEKLQLVKTMIRNKQNICMTFISARGN